MNAISVRQLGKKFKLFTSPGGRFLEYMSAGRITRHTDFWALQDITFEIPSGTTLGILGQNGSGKSTLLSILAGVLEPSAGSFEINGKVSAILELGSGFHPEFSGRDNIYMYGSIMGLSKQEVDDRFDEIVRFSELGDFINQPLRTYSSGMSVRLAFSVAVNVDADILIVDEALAVGDAVFQHRCFRKIRELQEAGKTILYVGHDTEAVRNICTQALLLDGGRIIERGDPNTVVNKYFALITERERTYNEGQLIEHGDVPTEGYETVYDFIQHFSEAKIVSVKGIPIRVQTEEIKSVPRHVIFAHPPSQMIYNVSIETRSSLAFAIGILPTVWDKIPQGVKFEIKILYDGLTESIFSRTLIPKRNLGDRGWHNFILPLEKFSGKNVSIEFCTSGSGEDLSYCWSVWGWGKLIQTIKHPNVDLPSDKPEQIRANILAPPSEQNAGIVRYGNKKAVIENIELLNSSGSPQVSFKTGDVLVIRYTIVACQDFEEDLTLGFIIRNKFTEIYGMNTRWKNCDITGIKKGNIPVRKISMRLLLGKGTYSLTSAIAIVHPGFVVEVLDRMEDHVIFHVNNDQTMLGIIDLNAQMEVF
jgi:ABC-type polysaccharide/polyol phosphate transport system ATPase subunit